MGVMQNVLTRKVFIHSNFLGKVLVTTGVRFRKAFGKKRDFDTYSNYLPCSF